MQHEESGRYSTRLAIRPPKDFTFWHTAYSHGWSELPPFTCDEERRELGRILELRDGTLVWCKLRGNHSTVTIESKSNTALTPAQKRQVIGQVRTCLRIDEDFSQFHRAAKRFPAHRWIARNKSGRLLRAPTVFEDVIKMICTTNCTWGLTRLMVGNLVRHFGKAFGDGGSAFPKPEKIASSSEAFLRREVKAGYRAPYLLELAERVAGGKIDPEGWRTSSLPNEELFKQMRAVKGIGAYAAGNLMKLVGRYDYLGLDSWVRAKYYELHRNGRRVKDSTIENAYKKYGEWRGLFFWLEMTRHWHDEKFRSQ